jgi:hypothetical protein
MWYSYQLRPVPSIFDRCAVVDCPGLPGLRVRGSFDWFIRLVIQMRIGRRHEPNLFRTPSQRAQDLQSSGEILLSTDGVTFIAKPQTDVASESSRRHLREELGWSVDIAPLSVDGSSVISRYTCHSVRL